MATDYPRIARLSGGLNDDKDDALRTLLTDVSSNPTTLKFITDKNATVIQSQIYRIPDVKASLLLPNITSSGASTNDSVSLSGADSLAAAYEFNFKVEPDDDDSNHNILGSLSNNLVLKLSGNPDSTTLNNAKILNKDRFALSINANAGLGVNGDLSDAKLSASLAPASDMINLQPEEWTVSNGKAQVAVMDAGLGSSEDNDNNVYYVKNGNSSLLSNAAAQNYDAYFDASSAQVLKEKFGSHPNLDVVVEVGSAQPSLENNDLLSLLDASMSNVTNASDASANVFKELTIHLSRDENSVNYNNGLLQNQLTVSRLRETLPAEASGNTDTNLIVDFDSSDRASVDCSVNATASVDYSTLSEANKTTENVSFTLAKERNPWNVVSSAFYTSDASYNEAERLGNVNLGAGLNGDAVFKLTKQDTVSLKVNPSNAIRQVDFSATDLSNNKQIDVCGSVVVNGTVQSGLDLSATSLRVLFEPNHDADAKWDQNQSSASVSNASVDLTGITEWDIAVNDDFFNSADRSYSYVLNSADSADPGARIIFQNEVGLRTSTGLHLQGLTVTSNRKTQNRVTNSNAPISIFINLNDSNVVDYSYSVVNGSGHSATVTHNVKIKKHFVAGLGGLASVSRNFYQYTIVAQYDVNGNLISSGNKFDQDGFSQVVFDVNAYTHSAKLMYGSTQLAGPVSVDFRVMSKGFVLDLEDGSANLNINSINLSILDGGRNAKVYARDYELVLTKDANTVTYAVESKLINGLDIPDAAGNNDLNASSQTTGNSNIRLKDSNNNTLLDLTLNSLLSNSDQNIYVVVRRNAQWNVNGSLVAKSNVSGNVQFQMADGVTLDVSVSSLFDSSSNQIHNRDFKLGQHATVSLKNDKFIVSRWLGDASGSLQPIPSDKVLLDQSGVTQVFANAYRGFAHGAQLSVGRKSIGLSLTNPSGSSIKYVSVNKPLFSGQAPVDVDLTASPFSSLKVKLNKNPDSYTILKLTIPRPSVYLAVCPAGSTQKLASATSSSNYNNLLFSNMFGASGESVRPFSEMLFLNNMVQPSSGKIKMKIRSGDITAVSKLADASANVPLDGTSVDLLPAGFSAPARLSVRADPVALRLEAKSVVLSVKDSEVLVQFRDASGSDVSVTKNLFDVATGTLDLSFDKDANGNHETGNHKFEVEGLTQLLSDPSSVSLLHNSNTSYSLSTKDNLFSIYKRFYDPSNSNWTNPSNAPEKVVDRKALSDSSVFEQIGSNYSWKLVEGDKEARLSFSNPMQRPILAIDPSNELFQAGNRRVRFESWHLEQANDASGVERMNLVHSHSQLLNLGSDGNVQNLGSNVITQMNGMNWMALKSIEVQKYLVNASEENLKKISLEKICSFDQDGCALPPWPGNVNLSNYDVTDSSNAHDGSYNDHSHSPNTNVRMMTIGFADETEFNSQLLPADRKTGPQGNVAYRVVLQDLLHIRDHNQMLALRVDPAGGVHTNALYAPSVTSVTGGLLAPMPPATGLNVRV